METRKQVEDKIFNDNWVMLLKIFHSIYGMDETAKTKYESLKELAQTKELTYRQMDSIISRCNYRIHLIDNPTQIPFSNMERQEKRLNLTHEQSNGKSK